MLEIQIPANNIEEREYVIGVLFSEFLGLPYDLITSDSELHYSISFGEHKILVKDAFFSQYRVASSYLSADSLPGKIVYARNEFTPEDNIPIIFGTETMQVEEKKIFCGVDIFASSFFMLTRWEEYVNRARDKHQRFSGEESIAFKNNFLHRPVVNEYAEMLWNMLVRLDYKGERKERKFELCLTHDVDAVSLVSFKSLAGDVLKRKDFKLALKNSRYLFLHDPFDTYDFLMTASEKLGVKSHFYFMSTNSKREYDSGYYLYRRMFHSRIKEIKKRGHIIGFHPGYYTFDDPEKWLSEKERLEEAVQQEIVEGRQHFLRMDVTKTLPIWEKNRMEIDSTLGYTDKEGFRCGTGDLFPVFNFLERKQSSLEERPLIIMDGTLLEYREYSKEQAAETIRYYISVGKKYKTIITLLFHNSSFFGEWEGYETIYKDLLNV